MQASPSSHGAPGSAGKGTQAPAPSQAMFVQARGIGSTQADPMSSNRQVDEQQSPLAVLPSSHSSPNSTMSLPQMGPPISAANRTGATGLAGSLAPEPREPSERGATARIRKREAIAAMRA